MTAVFSRCRRYRYTLHRRWGDGPIVNFVMLNPSTADDTQDDPTIRLCILFAKLWGYGGLDVTNIFAFRSTDPKRLYELANPSGPENDAHIVESALRSSLVVCAWGAHGELLSRGRRVLTLLEGISKPHCLGRTLKGHPRHPLYLPRTTVPEPLIWEPTCVS